MSGPYGPNTVAAERLLDDLDHLPAGAVSALAAAGGDSIETTDDNPVQAARAELRSRLREIARSAGRLGAVRAIGDEVAAWAASTTHWFPAGVAAGGESTAEMSPRVAAVPMVLDAAYAVVLEDLLEDDELDVLLGPWEEVVGSPFGERDDRAGGDEGVSEEADEVDEEPDEDEFPG